jgi:hypothetical protein
VIPKVFLLSVPGVGDFSFKKRSIRDQVWIESDALASFGRLRPAKPILPDEPDKWTDDDHDAAQKFVGESALWENALAVPTLERLAVTVPAGWNPAEVDPLDPDEMRIVMTVYRSLRQTEESFRQKRVDISPQGGAGSESNGGIPVPAPVQPPAV